METIGILLFFLGMAGTDTEGNGFWVAVGFMVVGAMLVYLSDRIKTNIKSRRRGKRFD